jgi:CMP-N-acetylneuraminic acid synthetase
MSTTPSTPAVSVYIPCHNYGRFLLGAVASVERQSHSDWELLVVDDGSSDETPALLDRLSRRGRVRVFRNEPPHGHRTVANQCFNEARAPFVLRLDADDELHPRALELLVQETIRNPSVGIVFPDYYYLDERGRVTGVECLPSVDGAYQATSVPPHGAGSLVSRELVQRFGGFDEALSRQDGHELWLRMLEAGAGVCHLPIPLFYYRQHPRSLSKQEDRLLEDRALIKHNLGSQREAVGPIVGILTVCNTNPDLPEIPFAPFEDSNLLQRAIEETLLVDELDDFVVTTDCARVAAFVRERFPQVLAFQRAPQLCHHDADMRDILSEAVERLALTSDTLLCVLSLHTPLRRARHVRDAIDNFKLYDVDSVVTVYEEQNLVYQLGAYGLDPINPGRQYLLRREREAVYVDNSAVRLFPAASLRNDRFLGTRIGHVLMSRAEAFKINTMADLQQGSQNALDPPLPRASA